MFSIVGRKVGMTKIFSKTGEFVSATAVEVEPNLVVGIKSKEKHGYSSVVVGYGKIRQGLLSKPVLGQYKKHDLEVKRYMFELKGLDSLEYSVGDEINLKDHFKVGDLVDIQGHTRGHGFTGAIKLWNFSCGPKAHGAGYPHRFTGSLETGRGGSAPQKVWKGKRMSGRYGNEKVSAINLEILMVDVEKNLFFVRGAVPGRSGSIVKIKKTSRCKKEVSEVFEVLRYEGN